MSFGPGPGPVVYSLSQWTELNLSAIIQATDAASAVGRIESLLSKDAFVTINGKASSAADLAGQLNHVRFPGTQASISFKEAVEVPADSQQPPVAGSVGIFFTSTIDKFEIIHDTPPQQTLTASVNVVIADAYVLRDVAVPGGTIRELNAVIHQGPVSGWSKPN